MMETDKSAAVRRGEELDRTALRGYLQEIVPEVQDGLQIRQFPGGFSNLTYLVRAGDRELILRRAPHGANIASAHDMSREYRVLCALDNAFAPAPTPIHYCDNHSIIGADFFLMQRINGVILRPGSTKPAMLDPEKMRGLSESFITCLAQLHAVDTSGHEISALGKPDGYVGRQVSGWIDRYEKSATDDIAEMEMTARWLTDNQPDSTAVAMIHNDFKYDNLVLDTDNNKKITGVLDWEMATVGDPLMDLGMSLAYWAEEDDPAGLQNFGFTHLPGNYRRMELVNRYAQLSGRDVDNVLFYYRFGLYKLAVILQQIYARYRAGHTEDPRFASLIDLVRICASQSVNRDV